MNNRFFAKVSTKQEAILPKRATKASAGYDLCAYNDVVINPGEIKLIATGIKAYMQDNEALYIFSRSSLATKRKLRLANSVGVIDADYFDNEHNEGEIFIPLHNFGEEVQYISAGDKIAQAIFMPYLTVDDEAIINNKREGGFGSTGN